MIYSWQIGGGIMSHIYCFLFKKTKQKQIWYECSLIRATVYVVLRDQTNIYELIYLQPHLNTNCNLLNTS